MHHVTLSLFGFLSVLGFLVWVATSGAPPVPPLGIAGLVVLGAFVGFAAGYGLALTASPASDDGSRPRRAP